MKEIIALLEKAIKEAGGIEVLGMVDREYLNRAIGHIKEAVSALQARCAEAPEAVTENAVIETDIVLPEADIEGFHFNETKVHAVFEKDEDGAYYSRDILFLSARDADEGTGRDLLSEYLDSEAVREAFQKALGHKVRVFLPEENRGIKKYNGVSWGYWLRPRPQPQPGYSGSAANVCGVHHNGRASHYGASAVGGCAPAFRIKGDKRG